MTDVADRLHDYLAQYFGDNLTLPVQFQGQAVTALGERRLCCRVLMDALKSIDEFANATDRESRAMFREDWLYFMSTDRSWPFSFENLCDVFGLNANFIRAALIKRLEGARREAQAKADEVSELNRNSGTLPQGWPNEAEECATRRFEELAEAVPV